VDFDLFNRGKLFFLRRQVTKRSRKDKSQQSQDLKQANSFAIFRVHGGYKKFDWHTLGMQWVGSERSVNKREDYSSY